MLSILRNDVSSRSYHVLAFYILLLDAQSFSEMIPPWLQLAIDGIPPPLHERQSMLLLVVSSTLLTPCIVASRHLSIVRDFPLAISTVHEIYLPLTSHWILLLP